MLDLDSRQLKEVKIGGKVYSVAPLKVRDQIEMAKALKGLAPESMEHFEVTFNSLSKCGLPVDVLQDMDTNQLKLFIEFLAEKKS
jgi:hypothetical protein